MNQAKQQLREFIDEVIVPALLERFLREHEVEMPPSPGKADQSPPPVQVEYRPPL